MTKKKKTFHIPAQWKASLWVSVSEQWRTTPHKKRER